MDISHDKTSKSKYCQTNECIESNIQVSCKLQKLKHLIVLQNRLHQQKSARNMFCCVCELFMKDLNIQPATGQVSERFNALFISE